MRDLIWTLIIVWLTWQIVNIFRGSGTKRQQSPLEKPNNTNSHNSPDRQRKLDSEGEYVDFEELK